MIVIDAIVCFVVSVILFSLYFPFIFIHDASTHYGFVNILDDRGNLQVATPVPKDPPTIVHQTTLPTTDSTPSYTLHRTYNHDASAFTEGFFYAEGRFFESTGSKGQSFLREIEDLESGNIVQEYALEDRFFGEGIALMNHQLFMLTYKAKRGLVLDRHTFELVDTFSYDTQTGEGWGMTTDGNESFIVSDGSSNLYLWTFDSKHSHASSSSNIHKSQSHMTLVRKIPVTHDNGEPLSKLNELEYIHGRVWANVWFKNEIVCIDLASGKVIHKVNLQDLVDQVSSLAKLGGNQLYNAVMNGIAYHPETDRMYITGKYWNKIFEIQLHV